MFMVLKHYIDKSVLQNPLQRISEGGKNVQFQVHLNFSQNKCTFEFIAIVEQIYTNAGPIFVITGYAAN